MRYVIDASVLIKTALPEKGSDIARQLLDRHRDNLLDLVAPDFVLLECANVLWKRTGLMAEITADEAGQAFATLREGGLLLYPSADFIRSALAFGLKHRHPIYDSIYIAMALDLNCGLVTADERLVRKFGSPPVYALEQFRT